MKSSEKVVNDGGDEEEEHVSRLMALLHDVVRTEGGRMGTGRELGIDRRTVASSMAGPTMAAVSSSRRTWSASTY